MLLNSTPELSTNFVGPLSLIENIFLNHRSKIETWFNEQWQHTLPPIYGSVDLRNAGFKLAPIDMNLFPAGFNNLNPNFLTVSVSAAKKIIQRLVPNAQRILLVPESHTRNLFYWENIKTLQSILEKAGFAVQYGALTEEVANAEIILQSGAKINLAPLKRKDNILQLENFIPDFVLLNNDLSAGIPDILQNLQQPIVPPAELGWSQRLKSEHFNYYATVADKFAQHLQMDAWLIAPLFKHCGQIDFMQHDGLECLVHNAEILFADIEKKYKEYQIPYQPFLVVKADAGTYGMAVMTVRNIDELKSMNRKQRTRMSMTKGNQPVRRVIIQEGVYTFETFGPEQAVAEPVVYLWGSCVVGGFYRVHKERGNDENLNAPGMRFEPIAFSKPCDSPCIKKDPDKGQNRFYIYGLIAQLSMLAAALEIKDQAKK